MTTGEKRQDSLTQNSWLRPKLSMQNQQVDAGIMESTKRRSRSLNELPGHLRVPVLRRKDTERTQARLEAGVAGLAELRLLKQKQMAIVEQTVTASVRQKQRPLSQKKLTRSSENLDYEDGKRKREQIENEVFQPWQSTASLCSITEEASNQTHTRDKGMVERLRGGSLCMRSTGNYTGSVGSHQDRHQARYRENRQNNQDLRQVSQEDRRQAWQDYNHRSKETYAPKKILEGTCADQTKKEGAREQCDLHEYYNTKDVQICRANFESSQAERRVEEPYSQDAGSVSSPRNRTHGQKNESAHAHRFHHKRAASVDTPFVSKETPNFPKKMSWDNLLVLAGLQTQSFELDDNEGDDVFSQSLNSSNITRANTSFSEATDRCTNVSFNDEDNDNIHVKMKKGRSHSFCCNNGLHFKANDSLLSNYRNGALDNMDTETKEMAQSENIFALSNAPQTANEAEKAKAIIRRASIQCETVLTGGRARNRKIFNPLHEIDVVALQSPGPLHAVTLQYKSIPLNALPEDAENTPLRGRSASVCSFSYSDLSNGINNKTQNTLGETSKAGDRLQMHKANKSAKQPVRHCLHPILENGNKPSLETFVKRQHENDLNANLEVRAANQRSCKSLSELETQSDTDDHLIETVLMNRTESKGPKTEVCPSAKSIQNVRPSSSLTEINALENTAKPVSSSIDSNSETLIDFPPPWTPDVIDQPDTSTPISSPKSQEPGLYPHDLLPNTNESRPQQTPDESLILSDDGYSTCDSLAPHSRLSIGPAYSISSSSSTSDWSSLSSGSVSNVSVASTFLPSSGLSSGRRNLGFRHLRYSHPPNSFKASSDLKPKSCSAMPPSPAKLSHVPEASNLEITQSNSQCRDEPCISKESTRDYNLVPNSMFDVHENVQNFDSVFADDLNSPVRPRLNHAKSSCKDKDDKTVKMTSSEAVEQSSFEALSNSNDGTKSPNASKPSQNNFAVLEEGSVIQLSLRADSKISTSPQNSSIMRTKYTAGRVKVTPNKNVRQTAV